jgi:hypothetical protein
MRGKAARKNLERKQEKALNTTLTPFQSHYITILGRRIMELRCVSQLVRLDMDYVRKVWQREMEEILELRAPKHSLVGNDLILTNDLTALNEGRNGAVIKAQKHGRFGRHPSKCWRCNERHEDGDPVCPIAREDPEQWHRLTTKVGGRRGTVQPTPIFEGKKVVFGDNQGSGDCRIECNVFAWKLHHCKPTGIDATRSKLVPLDVLMLMFPLRHNPIGASFTLRKLLSTFTIVGLFFYTYNSSRLVLLELFFSLNNSDGQAILMYMSMTSCRLAFPSLFSSDPSFPPISSSSSP